MLTKNHIYACISVVDGEVSFPRLYHPDYGILQMTDIEDGFVLKDPRGRFHQLTFSDNGIFFDLKTFPASEWKLVLKSFDDFRDLCENNPQEGSLITGLGPFLNVQDKRVVFYLNAGEVEFDEFFFPMTTYKEVYDQHDLSDIREKFKFHGYNINMFRDNVAVSPNEIKEDSK